MPHVYSYVEPKSPFPLYIALGIDIIVLILWTALNPLEYSRLVLSETIDLETGLVTIDSVGFCSAGGDINAWFFAGPIAVVHAALLLRIVYLYFANKGKEDKYNQRQMCLFAALYSAQLLLIGVPVVVAFGNNTTARYAVMCGLVFCNDLGVVSIIFFPIRNRRKTCEEYKEEVPLSNRAKLKKKAQKAAELRKAKDRKTMMNSISKSASSDSHGALDLKSLEDLSIPEPSMSNSSLKIQNIDQFDCTEQSQEFA
jgi:hypothetical protein